MIIENIQTYVYHRAFIYQSLATLSTYLAIKLIRFIQIRKRRYQLFKHYGIPGPEPRLIDGNLSQYASDPAHFKIDEENFRKYGSVYGYFIGDEPSIVITDLDLLRLVFLEESGKSFTERSNLFIKTIISHGVLFASYPRWKVMRKIMSHPFSSYALRGENSTLFIEKSIELMLNYIEEKLSGSGKALIDIQDLMKATTLHVISEIAVRLPDVQIKEKEKNVRDLDNHLASSSKGIVRLAIIFPPVRRMVQMMANYFELNSTLALIHAGLRKTIEGSVAKLSSSSTAEQRQIHVIDTLIKLHLEGKLTRNEVLGNAETLLFAGYDTTATTLAYIFWVIAKKSEVQSRLRDEIKAHGVESKYLLQVINETMRMYPVVVSFTTRLATQTVTLKDLTIPQGTRVMYNAWLMNHNPEIFPDPYKFDPERFREGVEYDPCAFAPFGLGDRKCLGIKLAMLEMKVIVCDVLLRYKLKLKSPENLELVSFAHMLTTPKEKVIVELEKLRMEG